MVAFAAEPRCGRPTERVVSEAGGRLKAVNEQRGSQGSERGVPGVVARSRDGRRVIAKPPPLDDCSREELEEWCAALIDSMRPDDWPVSGDVEGTRG